MWFVFTVLTVLVVGTCLVLKSDRIPPNLRFVRPVVIAVFLALWGLITVGRSTQAIQAGEIGVVYRFGEIVGQRSEGIAFIFPWEEIRTADTKVQRFTFEQVTAASQETQDVFMTITLNYSLSANAVQELFREVGPNWFDVIVPSRVLNFTKAETAKYPTGEIIPSREAIRKAVLERLAADLEPFSITVTDMLIDNIDFSPEYKSAIEAKQVATEQAKQAQEKVAQSRAEAEQKRQEALGERDAAITRAEGVAEANRKIAESLTPEILQFQAIDKLSDNVQIALIPSGEGLIIDPSTLLDTTTDDGQG